MSSLAKLLADLYPDAAKVRLLLRQVAIDPNRINLEGDAIGRWGNVLEEALRLRKLRDVVDAATRDYDARGVELQAALSQFVEKMDLTSSATLRVAHSEILARPSLLRYYFDLWFPGPHRFLTLKGTLEMPREWPEINRYLRDFFAKVEHEMHEKTYLPLAAKPLPPSGPMAYAALQDPFVSYVHQVILELIGRSVGGDSVSAPVAAASRRNRLVRNILRCVDKTEVPLMLLGEPGSGKTMTLQNAAMLLAKRESRRIYPRVPLYLRVGEFHSDQELNAEAVWLFVKRSAPSSILGQLAELERDGRLVLIFDGMDEMSRDRYSKHTEALSVFASQTLSKSLFSCRITDFSPEFIHQRLVLLPFDQNQVAEYLRKYVKSFPVVIDRVPWTLKSLANHIVHGELPIEANNPFVLWLLCLYMQAKKSWPSSRVEMLRFYNEENYRRKIEENPAEDVSFLPHGEVFSGWARFAYVITERNKGSAIPVTLLEVGQDARRVAQLIWIGKRCGVLVESRDRSEEHLTRFEHHRFQEFFAALYIIENRPVINWLERLDAPRWQETMLNLILMGGGGEVVEVFAVAMEE